MSDLPIRLHKWATEEMKFSPKPNCTKMLVVDDLKMLCNGENAKVWNYIIRHVMSPRKIQTVKGNLKIKNIQSKLKKSFAADENIDLTEPQRLKTKKIELSRSLAISEANIQHLERSLIQMESGLAETEEKINKLKTNGKELQHKLTLLNKFYKYINDETRNFQQLDDELYTKILNIRGKLNKNDSCKFVFEDGHFLEETTSRAVQSTTEAIKSLLVNSMENELDSDSRSLMHQKLSSEIQDHLHNHVASQVISSLTNLSRENELSLAKLTGEVSSISDVPLQKEQYINSEFHVQQLLEKERMAHITKFIEAEKHHSDCKKFQQQVSALETVLEAKLTKQFCERPSELELIKKQIWADMELASVTESLDTLRNAVIELEESSSDLSKKKENLLKKHEKIQNFQSTVKKKTCQIRDLLMQNLNIAVHTFSQQQQMRKFAEDMLFGYNSQIEVLCQNLQQWISKEISMFETVPLSYLLTTFMQRYVPIKDLSIYRHSYSSELSGHKEMRNAMNLLGFKLYQGAENLLYISAEAVMSNTQSKAFLDSIKQLQKLIDERAALASKKEITEVSQKVSEEDKKIIKTSSEKITKYLDYTDKGIKKIDDIQEMVQIWWEQPAQLIPTDMKVDGCTLEHWLRIWSLALCKLQENSNQACLS